jgi:hypothetical protein
MPRFVDQGDFIASANQARRVLRLLGALFEEVETALQASSPPSPLQLAEWEGRLGRILTISPDPVPPPGGTLCAEPSAMELDASDDGAGDEADE